MHSSDHCLHCTMYLVLRAGVSFVLIPRLCPGRVRDHCLPPSNVAGGTYIALPANTALMEDGTLEAVLAVLELLAMDVLNEYLELTWNFPSSTWLRTRWKILQRNGLRTRCPILGTKRTASRVMPRWPATQMTQNLVGL